MILLQPSAYGEIAITETYIGRKLLLSNDEVIHSIHDQTTNVPAGYCYPGSGVADVLLSPAIISDHAKVTLIGMGAGSVLYYARGMQQWQCYEINPVLVQLLNDGGIWGAWGCPHLRSTQAADPRLQCHNLRPNKPAIYCADGFANTKQLWQQDAIIVDTFFGNKNVANVDAITRLLGTAGITSIFILHVSGLNDQTTNRLIALAGQAGYVSLVKETPIVGKRLWVCSLHDFRQPLQFPAKWLVLVRDKQQIAALTPILGWRMVV